MKKILIPGIVLLMFLTSCANFNTKNARISELEAQLDSATQSLNERDSALTGYLNFVSSIEKNLDEIRKRESMLSLDQEDFNVSNKEVRDKMVDDLQMINKLMAENRQKIAKLSVSLKGSKSQITQLKSLVEQLKQNMEEKEVEVQKLNQQVAALTNDNMLLKDLNDSLVAENNSKKEIISDQNEMIESLGNKSSIAYVATGPANELEKKNIIEKEGGILGIGAVEQLRNDLPLDNLQNIDIRNTFSIPINSKKAELVTYHPKDSYKMVRNEEEKKVDKLLILDPQKFWESSRCLVVVTK